MNKFLNTVILGLALGTAPNMAHAVYNPHSHTGGDARILHFHYKADEVFELDVNFRFITQIQFQKGESIKSIQLGDSASFQVVRLQRGDIITVKPLEQNAKTNMNIITNKRIYTFFLNAVEGGKTNGQNFRITFKYGNEGKPKPRFTDLTSGTRSTGFKANSNYELSGRADFAPIEVFDDGVNTYLRYTSSARRPAVFSTNFKGEESIVNFTQHPNHLIQLHGMSNNWSLRIDGELICIRKTSGFSRLWTGQPVKTSPAPRKTIFSSKSDGTADYIAATSRNVEHGR